MICANCRNTFEDDAVCCPHCGAPAKMRSSYPKPAVQKTQEAGKGFWKRVTGLFSKKD